MDVVSRKKKQKNVRRKRQKLILYTVHYPVRMTMTMEVAEVKNKSSYERKKGSKSFMEVNAAKRITKQKLLCNAFWIQCEKSLGCV